MKVNVKDVIVIVILSLCVVAALNYYNNRYQINFIRQVCVNKVETAVNLDKYRSEEQKQINEYIESATDKINQLSNENEINMVADSYIKKIKKLSTRNEIKQAELKKEKLEQEAIASLNANSSNNNANSGSRGCVGNGAENFY